MHPVLFNLKTLADLEAEDILSFPACTILAGYRGSIAHNMYVPKSDPKHIDDIDIIGVCVGGQQNYIGLREWGSRGIKEQM